MSAILCGKRSFFGELPSSPPVSKRVRYYSSSSSLVCISPSRLGCTFQSSAQIDQLVALFPDTDHKLLEKALEESGDDLDLAIKRLTELRLGSGCANGNVENTANHSDIPDESNLSQVTGDKQEEGASVEDSLNPGWPTDGPGWVELFVREMVSATNLDDARARAAHALEALEKTVCARASAEVAQNVQQENTVLKEQLRALIQENSILKRAVSIQHERQKELDKKVQELQQIKQVIAQYQEQLKTLEVNNYALAMHLKQAQQGNSILGHFNPHVFKVGVFSLTGY